MNNKIITQYIDGIQCRTQEPFDFSFLKEYGKVFKVFDEQGSGCIYDVFKLQARTRNLAFKQKSV